MLMTRAESDAPDGSGWSTPGAAAVNALAEMGGSGPLGSSDALGAPLPGIHALRPRRCLWSPAAVRCDEGVSRTQGESVQLRNGMRS